MAGGQRRDSMIVMLGSVAIIIVQHAAQSTLPPDGAVARGEACVGCNQPVSKPVHGEFVNHAAIGVQPPAMSLPPVGREIWG